MALKKNNKKIHAMSVDSAFQNEFYFFFVFSANGNNEDQTPGNIFSFLIC